jgi:hypothetical protein
MNILLLLLLLLLCCIICFVVVQVTVDLLMPKADEYFQNQAGRGGSKVKPTATSTPSNWKSLLWLLTHPSVQLWPWFTRLMGS